MSCPLFSPSIFDGGFLLQDIAKIQLDKNLLRIKQIFAGNGSSLIKKSTCLS